ncbi:DNA mismatch repair protein MutL, partial [Lysinibacillus xylanilyticus]
LMEKKEKVVKPATEQLNIWKPAPKLNVDKMNAIVEKLYDVQTVQESNTLDPIVPQPESVPTAVEESWQPTPVMEVNPPNEVKLEEVVEILEDEPAKEPFPALEVVGQIHGTYIVAQMEDGFYLIDQHAAQERIKYEFFREEVGQVNPNERQALLLPLTFHYAADEALILRENRQELEAVGVFLEEFGQASFVVREHPSWFPKGEEQEIIEDLIEQVLTTKKADVKKLREAAAIMMSCKKSIKANHYLTKEQMDTLLQDLRNADNPFTCPHGRPVLIHFTTYEVEKMFKRVM